MAYINQIKCISCGKSIPPKPEDATREELLCDLCFDRELKASVRETAMNDYNNHNGERK